jgi:succinoglycan biosynthesis protein ExoU
MAAAMRDVSVIITAMNAQDTIGRAVASALMQDEVAEVVVIDDASSDATAQAARDADDGSGRLQVIVCADNLGPAAARNLAILRSSAPLIAILDADDFLLKGRFAALADPHADWDLSADNILFASPQKAPGFEGSSVFDTSGPAQSLTFERFVCANISQPDRPRGELGFLKPVIRRAFLEQHGLAYDPRLRLGEDFDLYARMLLVGARFRIIAACGYVAVERENSLSACHSAADLEALVAADKRMLAMPLSSEAREVLIAHHDQCAARWHHRRFLDAKRERGLLRALADNAGSPRLVFDAAKGIAQDKWRDLKKRRPADPDIAATPRLLVNP